MKSDWSTKKLGEVCVFCGCNNKLTLTIDHKVPLSRGGKDVDENKQVCCWTCNQLKDSLNNGEFRRYYSALQILKDLEKIKIMFPGNLDLKFSQYHHP